MISPAKKIFPQARRKIFLAGRIFPPAYFFFATGVEVFRLPL